MELTMTETPRTDHHYKDHYPDMHDHITVEFARGLERELNACKRALIASEIVLRRAIDGDSFMYQVQKALSEVEFAINGGK